MVKENKRNDGDVTLSPKIIGIASLLKNEPSTSHRSENWPSLRSVVLCSGTPEAAKVQRSSQTQGGVQSKGTSVLRAGLDQERGGRTNPSPCCCSLPSSWAWGCTYLFTTIIMGGKGSILATDYNHHYHSEIWTRTQKVAENKIWSKLKDVFLRSMSLTRANFSQQGAIFS